MQTNDGWIPPAAPRPEDNLAGLTDDQILVVVRACAMSLQRRGLLLRVEQRPLQPLAQGNQQTVVAAVPGRGVVA